MMQERKAEKQKTEKEVLKDHMSNRESTMKAAPQAAVALTLIRLKKIYLAEKTQQDIQSECKACYKNIRDYLAEQEKKAGTLETKNDDAQLVTKAQAAMRREAVEHIIKSAEETPLAFANVDFNDPQENKLVSHTFPFNEVILLVWKSLCDDEKFAHNYAGTPQEALLQAKHDRANRLENFYSCLEQLTREKSCNMGKRNALIGLLNRSYLGVVIIEDPDAEMLSFLKEKLFNYFCQHYSSDISSDLKNALLAGLFDWMANSDTQSLVTILNEINKSSNVSDILYNGLCQLFFNYGVSFERSRKDAKEYVASVINTLNFSCDRKEKRLLGMVHDILSCGEQPDQPTRNNALAVMQKWIRLNYQPDKEASCEKIIVDFTIMLNVSKLLEKYEVLLETAGRKSEFECLFKACIDYFAAFAKDSNAFPTIAIEIIEKAKNLQIVINQCQKATLSDTIENFFSRWFIAQSEHNQPDQTKLYHQLLSSSIQQKIKLTDQDIQKLLPSVSKEELKSGANRDITPYVINRFFLHAILTKPEEWSLTFLGGQQESNPQQERLQFGLKEIFSFVKNSLSQTRVESALKSSSYPDILLSQIDYLIKLKEYQLSNQENAQAPARPNGMILLPGDFKTIDEYLAIAAWLGVDPKDLYDNYSMQLNNILRQNLNSAVNVYDFRNLLTEKIIKIVPQARQQSFFLQCDPRLIHKIIREFYKIHEIFPEESGEALVAKLDDSLIIDLIEMNHFINLFILLPVKSRENFYDKFSATILEKMDRSSLKEMMPLLPDTRKAKVLDHYIKYDYVFGDFEYLGELCSYLPQGQGVEFFEKHELKSKNINDMVAILTFLPEEKRKDHLEKHASELPQIIKNLEDLINIIKLIPSHDLVKVSLLLKQLTFDFITLLIKSPNMVKTLKSLPDDNILSLLKKLYPNGKISHEMAGEIRSLLTTDSLPAFYSWIDKLEVEECKQVPENSPLVIKRSILKNILAEYKSTSKLGQFLKTDRSETIEELRKLLQDENTLFNNKPICRADIIHAIKKDKQCERRIKLFQGTGKGNGTGTDKVIIELRNHFFGKSPIPVAIMKKITEDINKNFSKYQSTFFGSNLHESLIREPILDYDDDFQTSYEPPSDLGNPQGWPQLALF